MMAALVAIGIVLLAGLGGTIGVKATQPALAPPKDVESGQKTVRIAIVVVWGAALVGGLLAFAILSN